MISTSEYFNETAQGAVRPLDWGLGISFSKERDVDTSWFTLNTSALDGSDILGQADDQPIQLWDYYAYENMRDRVISLDIERSIEFPYNVQSAILDMTLDNHDGELSYSTSRAGRDILPKRPVRAYLGFAGVGVVPQFVGVTQQLPKYNGIDDAQLTWTADDFLSEIGSKHLENTIILENVTTGDAIAAILNQYGMDPSMYDLEPGLNTIPFLFFDNDKSVANALRELVEAEGGKLWLSETGVIKFTSGMAELDVEPVAVFDESNIIEYTPSQTDGIVNHVAIKSTVRRVFDNQSVYDFVNDYQRTPGSSPTENPFWIEPGEKITVWVDFDDPVLDLDTNVTVQSSSTPITDGSSLYATLGVSDTLVARSIHAEVTPFAKSAKVTIYNDFAPGIPYSPILVRTLSLFGRPARIIDEIDMNVTDDTSIEAYGDQVLNVENNFFGSRINAETFAERILERRANYNPIIDLKVKGNPALELGDYVQLLYKTSGDYKVIGIKQHLGGKGLQTELKLERSLAMRSFTLDQSHLNSQLDRLA